MADESSSARYARLDAGKGGGGGGGRAGGGQGAGRGGGGGRGSGSRSQSRSTSRSTKKSLARSKQRGKSTSQSRSRNRSTSQSQSDPTGLYTAAPYHAESPMNRTSRCPTAVSPSSSTYSRTNRRVPRLPMRKVPLRATNRAQGVSARTGVSIERLKTARSTSPYSTTDSGMSMSSASESEPYHASRSGMTDRTQRSLTPPLPQRATPPSSSLSTRTAWSIPPTPVVTHPVALRAFPANNTATRTARSISSSSWGPRIARSDKPGTPESRKYVPSAYYPIPSDVNGNPSMPFSDNDGHVIPTRSSSKKPLGSISQAPLILTPASRSSGHRTAIENSDHSKDQSTSLSRSAKKGRTSRKTSQSQPSSQTSTDTFETPTYSETNYKGISDDQLSTTGSEATSLFTESLTGNRSAKLCHRRDTTKLCPGCGQTKKKLPSKTSTNVFPTKNGIRIRINIHLDVRELLKEVANSANKLNAKAVIWLPSGIDPLSGQINHIAGVARQ